MNNKAPRIIISGGGTGGHVFPAISIAEALTNMRPEAQILFVGARGRLEMKKVPEAGYSIVGLPVAGIQRRLTWKNLLVPFKLLRSMRRSRRIIKDFKPDVVVGVGGYASGPVMRVAGRRGIPLLIQEQNSYAGLTNRLLASKASKICVAYEGMDKYFPAGKIKITGNPVRKDLIPGPGKKEEALRHFGLSPDEKTLLVIGGSLGARSINESIMDHLEDFEKKKIQLIWQCGRHYHQQAMQAMSHLSLPHIRLRDFIERMDLAYAAADVIVSRAGAGTISELALIKKPVILVPSPNVAEDHQTRNARSLSDKDAAVLIRDEDARDMLVPRAFDILEDESGAQKLAGHIAEIAKPDSAKDIAEEVLKLTQS